MRSTTPTPFDYEDALAACARGDAEALQRLYRRESRWLLGVALRIVRQPSLAEEVLQDAFLQIWRSAHTFQPALGSARGWIYTVVRHRALGELRRGGHEVAVDDGALEALAAEPGDGDASGRVQAAAIDRCLDGLDDRKREFIVLAFVDGYSQGEIATRTNTPLGTVKSAIRRGLLALKACLS